jgi:DNA-binding transcriptional LysR family regulator
MYISIKQLQIFVQTALKGSLSEAAADCNITQAAASIALNQLEQNLDTRLFDRAGKRLRLNSDGHELLNKATAIIEQVAELKEFNNSNMLRGNITIGASTTIANYILPQYIAKFKNIHPAVNFNLISHNTNKIVDLISNYEIDFGFIEGTCNKDNINIKKWRADALSIICHKKHPLNKKNKLTKEDLTKFNWVEREIGSGTKEIFDKAFSLRHLIRNEITLNSSEAIISYLTNNHTCLGYLSNSILATIANKHLVTLDVGNLNLARMFYIITNQNKKLNQRCQSFLNLVYE